MCIPRRLKKWRIDMALHVQSFDTQFDSLVKDAQLQCLCTGAVWGEGPVWMREDASVLWSDIPNNRMLRWSEAQGMTVWRENVEFTNGHTRDHRGDLLHCSHGLRAIVRTPMVAGHIAATTNDVVVVDKFDGKRLNSPNDIVVKRDGTIWFTDPPYGILGNSEGHQAEQEQAGCYVFCYDPISKVLRIATDYLEHPNGLAFSPDERLLYVSDTSAAIPVLAKNGVGQHQIVCFDVKADNQLQTPRIFAVVEPGLADGFRLDDNGWLYTSSQDSVQVYHPSGRLLGKIFVPEKVGNVCFGGIYKNELFIAASSSLYRIKLDIQGSTTP